VGVSYTNGFQYNGFMTGETAFRSDDTFTQEEFRHWLDERVDAHLNHYELLNGRIVMTPPAGYPHGDIEAALVQFLRAHVRGAKLGTIRGSSAGFDLPSGDTVEPDVSFVSTERQAAAPAPERGDFIRAVPNLVIEILSPSTMRRDRAEKKAIYERNGVDEYWLVDPDEKNVTVFVLRHGRYDTGTVFQSGRISSTTLPALALSVEEVFEF
jgi:Uma2 family endonuclease